jgi:hypothetical protein
MENVVIIDIGSPADSGAIERLMQAIEHRILRRTDALERYSQIGSRSGDPVIALVLGVIQEHEQCERDLLDRIAITLRDSLNWTSSPGAFPSPNLPEDGLSERVIATTRNALDEERVDARAACKLAERFSVINGGLDSMLLESAALQGEIHVQLLWFVLHRLLSRAAKQKLPAQLRAETMPGVIVADKRSAVA